MVVASGSIAGKIIDYQVISLQGCRLNFRVGFTSGLSETQPGTSVPGCRADKIRAKTDIGTGMSGLGAKQTCRGGGSDGKF
jgi:hypothetical protein